MHAVKQLLPIGISVLLAGCFDSDINTVRDTRFDPEPSFTTEQALEHRTLCQSTSWDKVQDSKGRPVVEYRCEIKGAHEYFEKLRLHLSEKLNEHFKSEEARFEYDVEQAQGAIAFSEEQIASYQKAVAEAQAIQPSDRVVALKAAIAAFQSKSPTELADVQLPSGYSIRREAGEYAYFKQAAENEMDKSNPSSVEYYSHNISNAESALTAAVAEVLDGMQQELKTEIENDQQYARESVERAADNLKSSQSGLEPARKKLEQLQGARNDVLAKIAAQRTAVLEKLNTYTDVQSAHEIYQWTVSKNQNVYLSYIGLEILYENGEQEDRSDPDAATRHLNIVLNDDINNYEKYVSRTYLGSSVKAEPLLQFLAY